MGFIGTLLILQPQADDFSYVGFAAIWGFVMFAEVLGSMVGAGILLIVTAGIIASRQRAG